LHALRKKENELMLLGNIKTCPATLDQRRLRDRKPKRDVKTPPCTNAASTDLTYFARGTRIATLKGDQLVETIRSGDKVITRGVGTLPVRWVGSYRMSVGGAMAPVVIKAGALSNHADLVVSPEHRVLFHHPRAELMFGSNCALIPVRYLINDETIFAVKGGEVECWHLLFDTHQIVYANGAMVESFFPSPGALRSLDAANRSAVLSCFPKLKRQPNTGYGQTAERVLRKYEATALFEGPRGPSADHLRRLFASVSPLLAPDQSH
jgi:hypothetical protein